MPKGIKSDGRKIILKVKANFEQEQQNKGLLLSTEKVNERVGAATGKCCQLMFIILLMYLSYYYT